MAFKFLDYGFDKDGAVASFRYEGDDGTVFEEKASFSKNDLVDFDEEILDSALFFASVVIIFYIYKD